jgi:hypothetical protein
MAWHGIASEPAQPMNEITGAPRAGILALRDFELLIDIILTIHPSISNSIIPDRTTQVPGRFAILCFEIFFDF